MRAKIWTHHLYGPDWHDNLDTPNDQAGPMTQTCRVGSGRVGPSWRTWRAWPSLSGFFDRTSLFRSSGQTNSAR